VITIVVASFFLWNILGISFLPGLFIIFAVILANYYLVEKLKVLQKTQMFLKDQRVKMTDEILEGIKV
jgi:ATP-binding cassette, subfamily C (CFTR/MRP), member 1